MSAPAIDPPKVEVFATVGRAFKFVLAGRDDFIALALLPIIGLAVLGIMIGTPDDALQRDGSVSLSAAALSWLFLALNFAIGVFFGVAWHRRFLVAGEVVSLASALSWKPRHTRFLKVSLALVFGPAILILPIGLVLAFMGPVGVLILLVVIFGLMLGILRLSLMLPAVAVDRAMTLDECLVFTRGNTWRLVAVFLQITLIASVADSLVRLVFAGLFGEAPGILGRFVQGFAIEFVALGAVAVGISALSSAYVQLLPRHAAGVVRPRVTDGTTKGDGRGDT